jgi:hypothetical protein
MGVLLDADADYLTRATGLGSTGIINWTMWGWHRRTSGVGHAAVDTAAILGNEGNASRHMKLGFDNNFGSGLETDPNLGLGDQTGHTDFSGADAHPPFDTWLFIVITVAGPAGSATMTAEWTDDDGASWHTGTRASGVEDSITPANIFIGRAQTGEAQTCRGDYAYWGARAEFMDEASRRALINRSATDTGDWGYWRLADASTLTDSSGNSRTLTAGGTVTNGADPTIPSGEGPPPAPSLYTPRSNIRLN